MSARPQVSRPEEGWYKMKLAKGGVFVPVRLWFAPTPDPDFPDNQMDRSPRWQARIGDIELPAMIAGREWDAWDCWLWCCGNPINRQEYEYLLSIGRWAAQNAPSAPEANPTRAIRTRDIPIPTWR